MIRCFKVKSSNEIFTSLFSSLNIKVNEIVCIEDESQSQWLINLSKRRAFILLPEEMDNLLKLPNEIKVQVVSRHRYEPRKHYTTYKLSLGKPRYFIEVYDGSSASYAYYFCDSRAKCNSLEKDLEEDNIMLY